MIHTQGTEIVKRTNEHLHAPDEQEEESEGLPDSSHHIVGECLQTVTEGTAAKLPKLDSLKRTIQRQRVRQQAAHSTGRVQAVVQRRAVPPVRLGSGDTEDPHLRNSAEPGDAAAVQCLVG